MASTAINLTSSSINELTVTQVSHGFSIGDMIRISGTNSYTKAIANSETNAEVIGIVSTITSNDIFRFVTDGLITSNVPNQPPGTVMFLSDTVLGGISVTPPSTYGYVSKPVAIIISANTSMYAYTQSRGALIGSTIPLVPAPGISGNILTSNGSTWLSSAASTSSGAASSFTLTAGQSISANNYVNIYTSPGVGTRVRLADMVLNYRADGWVTSSISSGNTGTVYLGMGVINNLTSLSGGSVYYLSTSGTMSYTIPSGTGQLIQQLGNALSTTDFFFNPLPSILLG